MAPPASVGLRGVPWGSVRFRLVAQAVVARAPLIYHLVSKTGVGETESWKLRNDTQIEATSEGLVGIRLPSASVSFRGVLSASAWSPRRWFYVYL